MLITFFGTSFALVSDNFLTISLGSPDSDTDGMPDWWEKRFANGPDGLNFERDDSQEDPDSDTLVNLEEFRHGTHPFRRDTDADLLDDGDEANKHKTNPAIADTDGGGKPDGYEVKNGTDPLNPDDDSISLVTITINLNSGWNLISLPVLPLTTSVTNVLAPISDSLSIVYSHQKGMWKHYSPHIISNLTSMEPGWGYWIEMNNSAILTISGSATPKSVHLEKGWNLTGYNLCEQTDVSKALSSVHGKYKLIWEFTGGQWKSYNPGAAVSPLGMLKPGHGYWIYTTETCTWILP